MGNLFGTHTPRPGKPVGIFFPDDLNEINDEDTLAPMQIQFEHAPTAPDFPATLDTFRTTEDANRSVEGEDNSAEAMDRDLNAEVSGPGEVQLLLKMDAGRAAEQSCSCHRAVV